MTTSTGPQTFRATVAAVAAKAKAILPEAINGRLEGAVKLVLAHDVTRLDDGSIEVGSSTDALKVYHLLGATCDCKDFTDGKAPEGWCRHRIAAGIQRRVGELLAAPVPVEPETVPEPFPDNDPEEVSMPTPAPAVPLPEAPASVNVRLTIAGREVQLTLRGISEDEVLTRLEAVLQRYPAPQDTPPPVHQGEGWCVTHQVGMRWNEGKEGRKGWWSHKAPDGTWCKGK